MLVSEMVAVKERLSASMFSHIISLELVSKSLNALSGFAINRFQTVSNSAVSIPALTFLSMIILSSCLFFYDLFNRQWHLQE